MVAKNVADGFLWHENTTLLLLLSGAFDAGAEAPNTARTVCPLCPAGLGRRGHGATSAGRAASKLAQRSGQENRPWPTVGRQEVQGWFFRPTAELPALHQEYKYPVADRVFRRCISTLIFSFGGEDNRSIYKVLSYEPDCILLRPTSPCRFSERQRNYGIVAGCAVRLCRLRKIRR